MRPRLLIVAAIVVVGVVGLFLARWLSTENRERAAIVRLLEAQARGDAEGMLDELEDTCAADPRCRADVEANAERLARPGEPKIIAYESQTARSPGDATGETRVAWTVIDEGLPVVQCVTVRREGTALTGQTVTLLALSTPIGNEASC